MHAVRPTVRSVIKADLRSDQLLTCNPGLTRKWYSEPRVTVNSGANLFASDPLQNMDAYAMALLIL